MFAKVGYTVLVCLAVWCAAAAATTTSDHEATRRWLVARYTEQRAEAKVLPVGAAAAERVVDRIEARCPKALSGAPLNQKDKLVSEVVQDLVLSGEASTRPAVEQFVTTVRPLRWSNRALDHIASLSAEAQLRRFAVIPTDFCADAAYWKAHDHEPSPATTAFLQALEDSDRGVSEPGWVERVEIQLRLLGNRTEKRLLQRIRATEFNGRTNSPSGTATSRLPTVVGFMYATLASAG